MPTASQWKILSRLLLKKAREAAAEDVAGHDHEADTDEMEGGSELPSSYPEYEHNLNKGIERASGSSGAMVCERMYQSIPEENTHQFSRANQPKELTSLVLNTSSDALEQSRSDVSPRLFQKMRPRSGKTVGIPNTLSETTEEDGNIPIHRREISVMLGQKSQEGIVKKSDVCEANILPVDCENSIKDEVLDQSVGVCKAIGEEPSTDPEQVRMAEDELSRSKSPARPCLKRSDSCFIRRPDSRTKSVRFGRPYSSTRLYVDYTEDSANKDTVDEQNLNVLSESLQSKPADGNDIKEQSASSVNNQKTSNLASTHNSPPTTRVKRPSSSGPAFWRAAQMVASVNKVALTRKASFPVEWQGSSTPFNRSGSIGPNTSLPRSPAFRVRRDSIVSRNFPGGQGFGRAGSPHSNVNPGLSPGGLKVTSNTKHTESNSSAMVSAVANRDVPYEPYVIRDGHLIKRTLKSPRLSRDTCEKSSIENGNARILSNRNGLNENTGMWQCLGYILCVQVVMTGK